MKYLFYLIPVIYLISSCGKSSGGCDETAVCYTERPDSLYIELQLSPSSPTDTLEVSFYVGNIDDGELYLTFLTTNEKEYFHMPVGEKYAAKAKYNRDNESIIAVDGDRLSADSYTNCEVKCYDWDDVIFDLTLDEN